MIDFAREIGAPSLKFNLIAGDGRSGEMAQHGELLTVGELLHLYHSSACKFPTTFGTRILIPPVS